MQGITPRRPSRASHQRNLKYTTTPPAKKTRSMNMTCLADQCQFPVCDHCHTIFWVTIRVTVSIAGRKTAGAPLKPASVDRHKARAICLGFRIYRTVCVDCIAHNTDTVANNNSDPHHRTCRHQTWHVSFTVALYIILSHICTFISPRTWLTGQVDHQKAFTCNTGG